LGEVVEGRAHQADQAAQLLAVLANLMDADLGAERAIVDLPDRLVDLLSSDALQRLFDRRVVAFQAVCDFSLPGPWGFLSRRLQRKALSTPQKSSGPRRGRRFKPSVLREPVTLP
jgi:hypothetical protein